MKPKISVIGYDGGFREKFFQIDSLVNQTIDNYMFEYLWVEYFDKVKDGLRKRVNKYPELDAEILTLDNSGDYSLDKCVNEGVRRAKGELIVVLDADTYLEPDVLEGVWKEHKKQKDLVLYVHRHDELAPPILRTVDNLTLDMLRNNCEIMNENNYGGFFSLSKENYVESGGYEEHPVFSGPDHAGAWDLRVRFENMGLDTRWHPDLKTYHVRHKNAQGDSRWNGFRVESQWKIIQHRANNKVVTPLLVIKGRYREIGPWWTKWLSSFDDKSIGFKLTRE